jgi:hypothetical protein
MIVRHLAELHGGSVEATSAGPGLGARFVVRLPVPALAPSNSPPSEAGDAGESGLAKARAAPTGTHRSRAANL